MSPGTHSCEKKKDFSMARTVPMRLLVTSTTLAALAGFALAYWRSQPPPYTPRAGSLLYKTKVNQIILTGPLRTVIKNPDGSSSEKIMVADKKSIAPGQSGFASVATGSAPAPPPSSGGTVASPTADITQFPINAADYKAAKDAVPRMLKEAAIPVDLKITMKEQQQQDIAPMSLLFSVSTTTSAATKDRVGITLVLEVQRAVVGNPIAREGEKVTIRTYKTGMSAAPSEVANQLRAGSEQLLKGFCDEWQVVQGLKNDEEETNNGKS